MRNGLRESLWTGEKGWFSCQRWARTRVRIYSLVGRSGEPNAPKVSIWTTEGEQIDEISSATDDPTDPGSFILPHGIAVDSRGDLYVAETTTTYRRARQAAARSGQITSFGAAVDCGPMPGHCHSLQKFRRRSGHEPGLTSSHPPDS